MAIKRLKYYIPVYGTRLLLKRIERLERERNANTLLPQYYEARIDALYEAIMHRLSQSEPIYFDVKQANHKFPTTRPVEQAARTGSVTGG